MTAEHFNWHEFLAQWSRTLLTDEEIKADVLDLLPAGTADAEWLGYTGASEEQIARAEARLGTVLPPSYRAFLLVSNGWHRLTYYIYSLWPVEEIDWFSARNQEAIDDWMENRYLVADEEYFVYGEGQHETSFRHEYLQTALQISDWSDSAVCLLNPQVVSADGEWEAWFFAAWMEGARRYRSFYDMIRGECHLFLEDRANRPA